MALLQPATEAVVTEIPEDTVLHQLPSGMYRRAGQVITVKRSMPGKAEDTDSRQLTAVSNKEDLDKLLSSLQ